MSEIAVSRFVAAPPERVWEVVTDLENAVGVLSGVTAVERLDGGEGFAVGTRWRETRTMFGREATEVMEVTAIDPGRAYTVAADGRGARYRSTVSVTPAGEGSTLAMTFGAEPRGVVGKILAATIGRLFAGPTRKALRQDLDDIAKAVE